MDIQIIPKTKAVAKKAPKTKKTAAKTSNIQNNTNITVNNNTNNDHINNDIVSNNNGNNNVVISSNQFYLDLMKNNNFHIKPSLEQSNIIFELKNNYNVIVDAVAGSGKTTTNIMISQALQEKNILLLTYNKQLKFETREKIKKYDLTNLVCHSYHSFCVNNYDKTAYTDDKILTIINNNMVPNNNFDYDLIILDEAQDITPVYYKLINKICK